MYRVRALGELDFFSLYIKLLLVLYAKYMNRVHSCKIEQQNGTDVKIDSKIDGEIESLMDTQRILVDTLGHVQTHLYHC